MPGTPTCTRTWRKPWSMNLRGLVDGLLDLGAGGVRVAIGGFAALAAQKLVDRHARLASFDIPERLIDAADGVVQHRAIAPVGAVVAGLPDVFDAIGGVCR